MNKWYKLGDIEQERTMLNLLNGALQTPSYAQTNVMVKYRDALMYGFLNEYWYRYLFVNDTALFLKHLTAVGRSCQHYIYNLLSGYEEINSGFITETENILRSDEYTKGNAGTTTEETTNKRVDIDTSRHGETIFNTGTDNRRLTGTTTTDNTTIGDTTDNVVQSETETQNGTTTNLTTTDEKGIKTTVNTPSADTVVKTIVSSLQAPQNTTGAIAGQGNPASVLADNVQAETPFEMNTQYITQGQETVVYTNLQKNADGELKNNTTVETWGAGEGDFAIPKNTRVQSNATNNADITKENNNDRTINTTTTNNGEAKINDNETITYDTQQEKEYKGNDDDTHNFSSTDTGTKTITGDNTEEKSGSGNTIGFSGDRSEYAKAYYDLLNKYDIVKKFNECFKELFSFNNEMDYRDSFETDFPFNIMT